MPSRRSATQLKAHPLTTGLHVAAAVADAMRPGDQLVLGASNPVRDAALVGLRPQGIRVRSNRGVAGIDGTVSTAIGAALVTHTGRHDRVDRRPDVRPRQLRAADRADRADAAQPDHRGVQRQRRRHLRTPRAGRPEVLRCVVADLRHATRRRCRRAVPGVPRREQADRGGRPRRRARRAVRGDAGAGGEGRPVVAAGSCTRRSRPPCEGSAAASECVAALADSASVPGSGRNPIATDRSGGFASESWPSHAW